MKGGSARLAQIHAACFTDTRHWSAEEFADLLKDPTSTLISHTSGFALARTVADQAEIIAIAVLPEAQHRGIGRALLDDLESATHAAGAAEIFLEVSQENRAAIALYQSAGFAQTGLRKDYYKTTNGRAVNGLILSKRLVK